MYAKTLTGLFRVILICLFVQASPASAQPEISEFAFDNGLRLIVIPDNRAPVVTHSIWYPAGSADDPAGKSGLAHFLEHLMFKGTRDHRAGEFSDAVSAIGGEENAFTTTDYTAYYQKVSPDALGQMMMFEADRMTNLVLHDENVLPEREVVLEERSRRVDTNPGSILSETAQATLFTHHPYGIPIIGWRHEIEGLDRKDAVEFYENWYRPANAIVVVAGDVEPEEVRKLAQQTYGKIGGDDPAPTAHTRTKEPQPTAARTVTYKDPRVTTPSVQRTYLVPSYFNTDGIEPAALDLLGEILGGSSTSRLHRAMVHGSEIAQGAGAYYQGNARDMTRLSVYASVRGETTISEIETALDAEIARLLAEGVSEDELERARKRYLKSLIYSQDSQGTLVRIIGSILAMGGTVDDFTKFPDVLASVTVDDVNRVARKFLVRDRSVTSYLLPEDK